MRNFNRWIIGAVMAIWMCGATVSQAKVSLSAGRLNPVADQTTIEGQLKRFKGQTQFLNPQRWVVAQRAAAAGAARADGRRSEQEADLFKVGAPGSKLLYLLNSYRGLQVISYEKGAEAPELVGRAPATGNWSDRMYYDMERERIIVLERIWYDFSQPGAGSPIQSRLVVYDVKNPRAPRLSQIVELEGEIADSRMVGQILYIPTSVRPVQGPSQKARGMIYSLDLSGEQIGVVDTQKLALPVSSRENMNIVEVVSEGGFKYYLIAVLPAGGWGWWGRKSLVEVVDISDHGGQIVPQMVVSARGRVDERSQTSIKENTLIVVSNYRASGEGRLARVAVETFKMPYEDSEVLETAEAEYRKLHMDRALKGLDDEAAQAKYKTMVSDPEMGLKGRFVRTPTGSLRKPVADFAITVGDTNGQHASLRDVRFENDLLYVFWVPENQVDPFDLFDLSQVSEKVEYLGRLQFDGWIDKAIPLTYKGVRYVLGLGWIVPNVDNENQRRHPQARLFEIIPRRGRLRAMEVDQIVLDRVWTNFNRGDRFVELRMKGAGRGQILFGASARVEGRYRSGGKILHFDLTQDDVFSESGLLVGNAGWVRRIFNNPEIERINSFSNRELATFAPVDVTDKSALVQAAHRLELARNIVGFESLGEEPVGVQLIRANALRGTEAVETTELRQVAMARVDAEKNETFRIVLKGRYLDHKELGGRLFVATQESETVEQTVQRFTRMHVLALQEGQLQVLESHRLAPSAPGQRVQGPLSARLGGLVELPGQRLALWQNASISVVNWSGRGLQSKALVAENCQFDKQAYKTLQRRDGRLFVSYATAVTDQSKNASHQKHYMAPVRLQNDKVICGQAVNIPGEVVALTDRAVVTRDERLLDWIVSERRDPETGEVSHRRYRAMTETNLVSLALGEGQAALKDMTENVSGQLTSIGENRWVYIKSETASWLGGFGRPMWGLRDSSLGFPSRGFPRRSSPQSSQFVVISLDEELDFVADTYALSLEGARFPQLTAVHQKGEKSIGVIQAGQMIHVMEWSVEDVRPRAVRFKLLEPYGEHGEWRSSVHLPGLYSWQKQSTHLTPSLKSLELSRGFYGVSQLVLDLE